MSLIVWLMLVSLRVTLFVTVSLLTGSVYSLNGPILDDMLALRGSIVMAVYEAWAISFSSVAMVSVLLLTLLRSLQLIDKLVCFVDL